MRTLALLTAAITAGSLAAADPADWTQWRGPSRDGRVASPAWPDTLKGDSLKKLWRVGDLGPSYSGPIVARDRVFLTQTVDARYEVVTAHDRKTGKELWRAQWEGSMTVPFFAARNGSWIRSTPALHGDVLYVAGMRDLLVAIDTNTGKQLWRLDLVKEFQTPLPDFGFVCSPLADETGVYVQAGGGFVKVDGATGKVLWRVLKDGGGMNGSAFSSPVFATLGGKRQVVVQTRTKLAGVDPATGEVLWSRDVPSFRGMNILTPVVTDGDGLFTSTYGGTTQLMRVKVSDGRFAVEPGWSLRYEGNMSTPVVVNGHAYVLGRDKRLLCVELQTGKEKWRTAERFGEYWSMTSNGDRILALDNRGLLVLLRANAEEFDPLGQVKVADSETWGHLAVCGDELYVRDLNGLTVYRWSR